MYICPRNNDTIRYSLFVSKYSGESENHKFNDIKNR